MPFACNSPYGSNSGSVASASTNLTDEIFSSIPATLLFVSISGCTSEYTSIICLQFSYIPSQIILFTQSTVPGRRRSVHSLRSAAPRLRRHLQIKYGACRDKRRTLSEGEDFCDYHLVRTRLKNFVKVPDRQVFALMQKTDCLNREAVSLTFSVSPLAKFCMSWYLRSSELSQNQMIIHKNQYSPSPEFDLYLPAITGNPLSYLTPFVLAFPR